MFEALDKPVPLWVMFLVVGILWYAVWLRLGALERRLREMKGGKPPQKPAGRLSRLYNRFIRN